MHILQVSKAYPPVIGGIERHIHDLSHELVRQGHEVTVLVCNTAMRREIADDRGVRVVKVASPGKVASMHLGPSTPVWLRRLRPDILHFHLPYPMGVASTWLVRPTVPIIATWHSDIVRQKRLLAFYRPLRTWFLGRARRILTTSPNLAESSPGLAPFRGKTRVVPLGIDLRRFALTAEVETRIRAIRSEIPGPIVLFVGRLVPYKGIEYLLQAMIDVSATLVVVGAGPLAARVRKMAADLGIAGRVIFRGEVSDEEVNAHMHACECLVLPSVGNNEAFGLVQLEAMACSRPVISTKLPTGVSFVNLDGETGLSVLPKDAPALAYAIKTLLQDPDLRARMGERGRRRVEREFNAPDMTRSVLRHYGEVLGGESREDARETAPSP